MNQMPQRKRCLTVSKDEMLLKIVRRPRIQFFRAICSLVGAATDWKLFTATQLATSSNNAQGSHTKNDKRKVADCY